MGYLQPDMSGGTRSPGGVALLYKEELLDSVLCVRMCMCVCDTNPNGGCHRELYVAIVYFPLAYLWFTSVGESPY